MQPTKNALGLALLALLALTPLATQARGLETISARPGERPETSSRPALRASERPNGEQSSPCRTERDSRVAHRHGVSQSADTATSALGTAVPRRKSGATIAAESARRSHTAMRDGLDPILDPLLEASAAAVGVSVGTALGVAAYPPLKVVEHLFVDGQ